MKRKITIAIAIVVGALALAVAVNPLLLIIPLGMTGKYGGLRSDSTLKEAHARAVNSFVKSKGFGLSRMRHLSFWNDRRVTYKGREYDPVGIQLIGLSDEMGDRIFSRHRPPQKHDIAGAKRRELSTVELSAVAELRRGLNLSAPIPLDPEIGIELDGSMRILAPLTLTKGCIECHDGEVGDLVGAFAYTLFPQDLPTAKQAIENQAPTRHESK